MNTPQEENLRATLLLAGDVTRGPDGRWSINGIFRRIVIKGDALQLPTLAMYYCVHLRDRAPMECHLALRDIYRPPTNDLIKEWTITLQATPAEDGLFLAEGAMHAAGLHCSPDKKPSPGNAICMHLRAELTIGKAPFPAATAPLNLIFT